jgi:hypothetical protein
MPKGSKVAKTEMELKEEARKKGLTGEAFDRYVYGTLNKVGLMSGNKATAKGRAKAKRGH